MKRISYLTLTALIVVLLLAFFLPTAIMATSPKTLDNSLPGEYDAGEWHFLINQINDHNDMPAVITVTWSNGSTSQVPLDVSTSQHKIAHYRDYTHLQLRPVSASAAIDSQDCGNFNISHGPSNATIIVVKNTDAGQATFNFDTSGGQGLPSTFDIVTSATSPFTGLVTYHVFSTGSNYFGVSEDLTGIGDWTLDSSSVSSGGTPAHFVVAQGGTVTVTFNNKFKSTQVLPELPSAALLGLGLLGVGGYVLFRRQKRTITSK